MRQRWTAIAGALAAGALTLAACVTSQVRLPPTPLAAGPAVAIQASPVALDPADPARTAVGDFAFAGGVALTSDQTSRLHGLSDLTVDADGRVMAVSDDGDLLTARLALDAAGRLAGLSGGAIRPLTGLVGEPLQGKAWGDAEGVTRLADRGVLVSFERHHRIWLYPAARDGRTEAVAMPQVALSENDGMEGLAAAPTLGGDAYWVGAEPGGLWLCRLKAACAEVTGLPTPPLAYRLSGLTTGPNGELVILHHSYVPAIGSRLIVTIVRDPTRTKTVIGGFTLTPPLTVDNFEGDAVVARPDGRWRFYLLSDDNFSPMQRTLLLAFDWTPPK